MEHILELTELDDINFSSAVASQYGHGMDKRLAVRVRNFCVSFEVEDHGELILETTDKHFAICAYNAIKARK